MRGEAQVYIAAPPEEVFRLISDVTRMGEWSPECRRCHWIGASGGPVVGARFRGHNRRGWFRWAVQCRVTDVEPGRAFAFETMPFAPLSEKVQTRWRYELEPSGNGTVLTRKTLMPQRRTPGATPRTSILFPNDAAIVPAT